MRRALWCAALLVSAPLSALASTPCQEFGPAQVESTVASRRIDEASGLVASRRHPDVFWVHNDSGDDPLLYAIRRDGSLAATFRVTGADARDWEDLSFGPCPEDPEGCLYIADFGNNSRARTDLRIYRVPEPDDIPDAGEAPEAGIDAAVAFGFAYPFERTPEPNPDAEALMIDPSTGDMLIATKEGAGSRVVMIPGDTAPGSGITPEEVGLARVSIVTAGDISPAGDQMVLRNYGFAYLYDRQGSWAETLQGRPRQFTLPAEPQGEAIAYGLDGRTLFTVSEDVEQPLYGYPCLDAPAPEDMGVVDMGAVEDMTPSMEAVDMASVEGDMGSSAPDAGLGNNPGEDGCSCRSVPAPRAPRGWWLTLLVVGLLRRSRDHG